MDDEDGKKELIVQQDQREGSSAISSGSSSCKRKESQSNDSNSRKSLTSTNTGVIESAQVVSAPPPPAKKTPNDFIFGKLLGEGSFSSVYLAKDVNTSKEYAIKVCDKHHILKEKKAESIRREKEVLTVLSANRSPTAPFFVHLYATFQDAQRLYFVVTFAPGGELLKYLHKVGSFEFTCCRFYTAEILQALRHLHTIGIVHRDLKPENILLNDHGHILVTDFGSAKVLKSTPSSNTSSNSSSETTNRTRSNSFVGTAQYVSPEVLQGRYSEVGPAADLWAFGCILFQLVSGILPFQAQSELLIFQKILKLEYEFPPMFYPEGRDLVEKLLKIEPTERLGSKDTALYESIQSHAFFKDIDFDGLSQQTPPVISPVTGSNIVSSTSSRTPQIPENYEPGFDPRVIAERSLKDEEDSPLEDEDDSDGGDLVAVSEGIDKLRVGGDSPKIPTIRSSSSILPHDEIERKSKLEEQLKSHPASHAAVKGNLILKQGLVNKRKGLFARRRLLFLTEGPHLYYCEPSSLNVKGEIPWSQQLRPEAKDFKVFLVHTPNRTYILEDPEGYALEWVRAINEIHQHLYGNSSSNQ